MAAACAVTGAVAQTDPFASAYQPKPGSNQPAPSTRTGATGVSTAVGQSYAGSQTGGFASLAQISMLPKVVPALAIETKQAGGKYLNRTNKVALTGYTLGVIRAGSVTASAMGRGSEIAPRRTTIRTVMVGVSDELAAQLAEEAYKDLEKRLTDAGFEVIPAATVQADPAIAGITAYGRQAKGAGDIAVYSPSFAPLRAGQPFASGPMTLSGATIAMGKVAESLGAIVLSPGMAVDYERFESSGRSMYTSNASAGVEVRFRLAQGSGAMFSVTPPPPYRGGWPGSITTAIPQGTPEPFGIMYEVDDRSDSVALHNAFAQAGFGSIYRQSLAYAVEVDPVRYAALTRAAFQGLNASIVSELQKARGK